MKYIYSCSLYSIVINCCHAYFNKFKKKIEKYLNIFIKIKNNLDIFIFWY